VVPRPLEHERGAYWTFLVSTPGHLAVGASPEAHVSAQTAMTIPGTSVVTMNPISGTFRHPAGGATAETLTAFLSSTKETEEPLHGRRRGLKMMSAVCSDGGRITGPHLKEMSRLTHTEYMLRGTSTMDPRDILRETMFAPTVTGSPMQNACTVIKRHEREPRGYYSGVAALFTPTPMVATTWTRPSSSAPPIWSTARCAFRWAPRSCVTPTRRRGRETHGKAAGVLGAIGAVARDAAPAAIADEDAPAPAAPRLADDRRSPPCSRRATSGSRPSG
jgi:phenazine biosynthesis protein phzE